MNLSIHYQEWPDEPSLLDGQNHGGQFLFAISVLASECNELIDLPDKRSALRGPDDPHATTSREVEQSFISKDVQSSNHRVLVHAEHPSQVDSRREAFTLSRFAIGDGAPNFHGHLFVKKDRLISVDNYFSHRTIFDSTITCVRSKEMQ